MNKLTFRSIGSILYRCFLSPSKATLSYSQCGEDMVLRYLLANKKSPGFYVDVGCHHPIRGSNTYYFYKNKKWRGILIDLEIDKIYACKILRPKDTCVVAAISDIQESVTIYSPKQFSVLTTINDKNIDGSYKSLGSIKTKTLTEVLIEYNSPKHIDLLCIDAEGVDLKVLKGLNFDLFCPHLICIEVWESESGISALTQSEIHKHLNQNAYNLISWAGKSAIYKLNQDKVN